MRTRRFSTHPLRRAVPVIAVVAMLGLLAGACSSDGDTVSAESVTPSEATTADGSSDDGGAFPVTIEHQYGSITLDEAPTRVVSVGYVDQDFLLALDVVPVAIRDWYGDQPFGTWPWAQDALDGAEPTLLASAEINFEQIAGLRPDLIVGVSSGMTADDYETLSAIAPTLAQSDEYPAYGVPWQAALASIGSAVGQGDRAAEITADLEATFASVVADHPTFSGEATVSYVVSDAEVGAYASADSRSRLLTSLGFEIPAEIDELAGDLFYSTFSLERIDELDRDLLVWIGVTGDIESQVRSNPLHAGLDVVERGAEIYLTELQGAAAGFSSPLSLPFLLESLVPQLEAATDGDPATVVPAA